MIVIVAYDVSRDDRRSRLAALLQSLGDRVQRSVFVLTIDSDALEELTSRAADLLDPDVDSFYIFRQCATCWQQLTNRGQAHPPTTDLHWAIM